MNKTHLSIQFELLRSPSDYRRSVDAIAGAISNVPGLASKLWIIDAAQRRAGGVYVFENRAAATAYLDGPVVGHLRTDPAIGNVEIRLFDVLEGPSVITRGLPATSSTSI